MRVTMPMTSIKRHTRHTYAHSIVGLRNTLKS